MNRNILYRSLIVVVLATIAILNQNCSSGFELKDMEISNGSIEDPSLSCRMPWGEIISDNDGRIAFRQASVPAGSTCESELRECQNGELSGEFTFQNCAEQVQNSCTLPWGGVLNNGQDIKAFAVASVPHGQTCPEEMRLCTNGSLSGSYEFSSCVIESPAPTGSGLQIDLSYVNLQSSKYQRFKTYVDSTVNGASPYNFSGVDAAYMYKLTNQNQYCTLAVNIAEAQVAAAETAIAGGGRPSIAGDSYLEVGPKLSEVAIAYDWCRNFISSSQRTRWANYADQAIYNVWNPSSATWGGRPQTWSGWSINNPGNNYFYSFVEATMFWALASNNSSLKTLTRQKMNMLNSYFSALPGGGSLEGTGYGQAHMRLFGIYSIWKDSTGEDFGNSNSHLTDSIRYWVHATLPNRQRHAAIGDQARVSQPEIFDYQRRLMLAARTVTTSSSAKNLASWWLNHISLTQMSQGFNFRHDLMDAGTNNAASPTENLVYRAEGVGQLFARTSWDTNALWLQFGAGTYNESHAHQDQGAFTLASTTWLTVTENIWSRSGIVQTTDVHNILRFVRSGSLIPQREGTASTMTINSQNANGAVNATANLTAAYRGDSSIQSWTRNIDFANRRLLVTDNYQVSSGTQAVFQVNVPVQPSVNGNVITAGSLRVRVLTPSSPTISIVNWNSTSSEYNSGYRIDIQGGSGQYVVELTDQ